MSSESVCKLTVCAEIGAASLQSDGDYSFALSCK